MSIRSLLKNNRLIPVITLRDAKHAIPLAETLFEAGIHVLEITLRTPAAMESIRKIKQAYSESLIAVGTITCVEQLKELKALNVVFAASPGSTVTLMNAAKQQQVDYLPGVTTCSEIMTGKESGYNEFKFFPAGLSGGIRALKNFHELFPDIYFCPTGGISEENMNEYLALPNVFCIGGSWIAPANLIESADWKTISERAKNAISLLEPV